MNLLLDTHAFVWFVKGSSRLSATAKAAMESEQNALYLSFASVWEMAIKTSIGRLTLERPLDELIAEQTAVNSVGLMEIDMAAILAVAVLPLHHRDPFDRVLATTALARDWPIVSKDQSFEQYGVRRIW